ncbi:Globin-like domain and Globin, structural domain-containing protein [Strongyloides ratti]|uniref:Globin-like domain and Globin, structural domain-containing protein n=1 Tax=Strongyloides ratti TaxID=34506 RepID=A0A090LNW6_STRRB|nr:Globin-like domain and Globin, structural domain-containing protein [Strongyloides ratti]CEF69185.1 Globin-like domain and Globin, structural domain-containing protein [Strongyloides ratti]
MRIMEAIQRKKLIQMLNDEYAQDLENEAVNSFNDSRKLSNMDSTNKSLSSIKTPTFDGESFFSSYQSTTNSTIDPIKDKNKLDLIQFTNVLDSKLSILQKKALKITWKRLSEAPRTSRKGMLFIMQRVFDLLIEKNSKISTVFYSSAFLSCLEDRKKIVSSTIDNDTSKCPYKLKTIATIRDHANLLLDFVNSVICLMFDIPYHESQYMGLSFLGCSHSKLISLGFDRQWFHQLGECFAEVMFSQECVRAFPHAASAWSLFAVTFTDKLYVETKWRKNELHKNVTTSSSLSNIHSPTLKISDSKNNVKKYSEQFIFKVNDETQELNE